MTHDYVFVKNIFIFILAKKVSQLPCVGLGKGRTPHFCQIMFLQLELMTYWSNNFQHLIGESNIIKLEGVLTKYLSSKDPPSINLRNMKLKVKIIVKKNDFRR